MAVSSKDTTELDKVIKVGIIVTRHSALGFV